MIISIHPPFRTNTRNVEAPHGAPITSPFSPSEPEKGDKGCWQREKRGGGTTRHSQAPHQATKQRLVVVVLVDRLSPFRPTSIFKISTITSPFFWKPSASSHLWLHSSKVVSRNQKKKGEALAGACAYTCPFCSYPRRVKSLCRAIPDWCFQSRLLPDSHSSQKCIVVLVKLLGLGHLLSSDTESNLLEETEILVDSFVLRSKTTFHIMSDFTVDVQKVSLGAFRLDAILTSDDQTSLTNISFFFLFAFLVMPFPAPSARRCSRPIPNAR